MPKINVVLLNAYANAYGLTLKKKYSIPKIYTANGNIKKRWYVYFSYRNPKTGLLERQTPIYGGANNYHTKEERLEILNTYRKSLIILLEKDLSPFDNNSNYKPDNNSEVENNNTTITTTISDAFTLGLKIKEKTYKSTSFPSFKSSINQFMLWLKQNNHNQHNIDFITKKIVISYLNDVLDRTSARTRNNMRTYLSALFQTLEDNEIIKENFIKKINVLRSTPERHKTYSTEQLNNLHQYLEVHDPILWLYVKFISYAYLRPIEACRLKVKDINIIDKTINVRAKNSPIKIKIIPEILLKDLPDFSMNDEDDIVFTPKSIGSKWETTEKDRRDYFTKRFKKVKDQLGLGREYGLYSFRHTFITKLYNEFAKAMTPFETKSKLMLITGHKTMDALEKYLRDIDAVLPEDYSSYL